MKAADLFIKALEAEGVEYVFGVPGEENLDLLDALHRSPIQLITTRHEQGAGFMAATYGRLTGKAGVCLSTLGPGATNLVTAAAYAQLGGMPMVMITGQKPIKSSKQGQFQIINVVDMMLPITKYTTQLASGDTVAARIREAFRLAQEERPGATHLELPEDVAREETDMPLLPKSSHRRSVAEHKALRMAADAIREAKRPLLMIGAGANRKLSWKMLHRLIDKLGIPSISTQMGKGVVNETTPKFIGTAAISDNDFVHRAIGAADLIVNIGHDVVEKPPFFMTPHSARVIHIDYSSAQVDPVYFPQIEVEGDIAYTLWQLSEALEPQEHWDFRPFEAVRQALHAHIESCGTADGFPVQPQRLARLVRDHMPEEGIIALDNGIYKIWFARNYPAYRPNTVLLDNALASMGAGLPSAIGAKLVHPERQVMAICGDGGFMMNSQELETAVRLKLDLIVLILNDNAYGMIKWKQRQMGLADFGLDYDNPDFVAYANAYGATGHALEEGDDLTEVLQNARDAGGVHVVSVPVDYSVNQSILNDEIPRLAGELDLEA